MRRPDAVSGGDAQCATPLVEDVHHIRFAKLNADRPASWTFGVVAIEVAIDAPHRHIQGDAFDRPAAHLLERWSHDPNQMTVVLPAEMRFHLPAVVFYGSHRTSPEITRSRATPSRTSNAPLSSMSSATP